NDGLRALQPAQLQLVVLGAAVGPQREQVREVLHVGGVEGLPRMPRLRVAGQAPCRHGGEQDDPERKRLRALRHGGKVGPRSTMAGLSRTKRAVAELCAPKRPWGNSSSSLPPSSPWWWRPALPTSALRPPWAPSLPGSG